MRFIMRVTIPVDRFNQAVRDGTVEKKMTRILDEMKPEGAYFTSTNGHRSGYFIINMDATSEIPRYAEPWFLLFDAMVEFLPVMTPEDLGEGGLGALGKKWSA